jgi:hypothetical protein
MKKLKNKIKKVLKKEQPTPTMVYSIYYTILLKWVDDVEDKIIKHIYLLLRRYIKEKGLAPDYILDKIKKAYEYNQSEWKKIDKVLKYVKKILDT